MSNMKQQSLDSEQAKRVSDADKEMEMRANRAKALLAERHVGLRQNQVYSNVCIPDQTNAQELIPHNVPDQFGRFLYFTRLLDNSARSSSRRE